MKDKHYSRGYGARKAWVEYYGSLPPKGHEIHHKDDNPYNNNIDNLELLLPVDHDKRHTIQQTRRTWWQIENKLKKLEQERVEHIKQLI